LGGNENYRFFSCAYILPAVAETEKIKKCLTS